MTRPSGDVHVCVLLEENTFSYGSYLYRKDTWPLVITHATKPFEFVDDHGVLHTVPIAMDGNCINASDSESDTIVPVVTVLLRQKVVYLRMPLPDELVRFDYNRMLDSIHTLWKSLHYRRQDQVKSVAARRLLGIAQKIGDNNGQNR